MPILNLEEAAAYLGVTPVRVRTLIDEGRILATKEPESPWQIDTSALDQYQNQQPKRGSRKDGKRAPAPNWLMVKVPDHLLEKVITYLHQNKLEIQPRYKKDGHLTVLVDSLRPKPTAADLEVEQELTALEDAHNRRREHNEHENDIESILFQR